jgi:hypothetical protein
MALKKIDDLNYAIRDGSYKVNYTELGSACSWAYHRLGMSINYRHTLCPLCFSRINYPIISKDIIH